MKIICDLESLVKNNKIDVEAASVLSKLKDTDEFVLITTSTATVNINILEFILSINANIAIKKCDDEYSLCVALGMSLANENEVNLVLKNTIFSNIKNTIASQNPNIIFGWGPKTKVSRTAKRKEATSKEVNSSEKRKKESAGKKIIDSKNIEKPDVKGKCNIDIIKSIFGNNYKMADYKTMEKVILEATDDSEHSLLFLCKINLPLIYDDDDFVDNIKKAYKAICK